MERLFDDDRVGLSAAEWAAYERQFVSQTSCSTIAHVQPSGSGGRLAVSGAAGSLYLPRPGQFLRRSVRMRCKSCSPVSKCRARLERFCLRLRLDAAATLQFGFGGDEFAFAGGFEDGGAVAFEVGLHPPQRRHPRLQPRELLLNLRHNAALFGEGWDRNAESRQCPLRRSRPELPAPVCQRQC